VLAGGLGCDVLVGGEGADAFRLAKAAEGGDTIADFVSGEDTLVLLKSGFGISKSVAFDAGDEFDFAAHYFVSSDGATATESHGQFLFDTASSQLLWDADGTGEGAAQLLAHFANGATPDAHDFLLI
jgi:Ca2+-binding RTX toxin-like protein